jgi:Lrp/AsnC family transcriptional regulator, regulator for asnA, asnC and gidA
VVLSNFDRELILALQQNGRAPIVDLASQLGAHVSTIAKRILALDQNQIMKVRAIPNPYKLGYNAHAFIAVESRSHKNEDICARLDKNFYVNLLATAFGKYDVIAMAFAPTWEILFNTVCSPLSDIDGIRVDTFLVKNMKKRHYGFEPDGLPSVKIDEVDQKIIERLTENGRYKSQHLAEELGISPPTCLRHITRLLNENVISIKSVINPSRLGYSANAFMFLQVQSEKLDSVCEVLKEHEDVFLVMTLINSFDLFCSFRAVSPEELYRLKNHFLSIDGVIDGDIIVRAEIIKRYYGGIFQ